jgi:hypothetical protein
MRPNYSMWTLTKCNLESTNTPKYRIIVSCVLPIFAREDDTLIVQVDARYRIPAKRAEIARLT